MHDDGSNDPVGDFGVDCDHRSRQRILGYMEKQKEVTCPTCHQPCGQPLSAKLADEGHDPLIHCEMLAIYAGKPCVPCVGQEQSEDSAPVRIVPSE